MDKLQTIHDNKEGNLHHLPEIPAAVRLDAHEQRVIREASLRWFGVRPRLFGSRVDTRKQGGDIDLYIETTLPPSNLVAARLRMLADIWQTLGERKIDIVVNAGGERLPIYTIAQQEGVWL